MEHLITVRRIAEGLLLLDEGGRLRPLDSMSVIDLVMALEEALGITIPAASLREEAFQSVETVAELLEELD